MQDRFLLVSHVVAKPSREIEEVVHYQDLRLIWIEEPLEKIGEYLSLLSVLVPEFLGAFLSPGACVAQGSDENPILEVDVPTETLIEISTSLAQSPRRVLFAIAGLLNATCVPNGNNARSRCGGARRGALWCTGCLPSEAGWTLLAAAYGAGGVAHPEHKCDLYEWFIEQGRVLAARHWRSMT